MIPIIAGLVVLGELSIIIFVFGGLCGDSFKENFENLKTAFVISCLFALVAVIFG